MMCMCVGLCINKVSLQSYNKYLMRKELPVAQHKRKNKKSRAGKPKNKIGT